MTMTCRGIVLVVSSVAGVASLAPDYMEKAGTCALGVGSESLSKARERLPVLPDGGGPDEEAAKLLREIAWLCPQEAAVLDEVGEGLRLIGKPDEAYQLFQLAVERGVWRHPLQRVLNKLVPNLKSAVFLGAAAMSELVELDELLHAVQAGWREFRHEFLKARRRGSVAATFSMERGCPPHLSCWARQMTFPRLHRWYKGNWAHYYVLLNGVCLRQFPLLCTVLMNLQEKGIRAVPAAVSEVWGPETYIPLHRSPNEGRLRLICPLLVPSNGSSVLHFPGVGKKFYSAGQCFWVDESYEHELFHKGPTRAALIVDLEHPGIKRSLTLFLG